MYSQGNTFTTLRYRKSEGNSGNQLFQMDGLMSGVYLA